MSDIEAARAAAERAKLAADQAAVSAMHAESCAQDAATNAAAAKISADEAAVAASEVLAALDGEVLPPEPSEMPVLDILDAPTITAGGAAQFPLRLDKPAAEDVVASVTVNDDAAAPVTIPAGATAATVLALTSASSGAHTLQATLATTPDAVVTIGRSTATCVVMAAGNGGNGGGGTINGDLEAIDRNALQIGIVIDAQQRQTVVGHGFGLGSHSNAVAGRDLIRQHAKQIFTDMNCKIVRVHNPQEGGFVESYKPSVETAVAHGVLYVLCTCYMYRSKSTPAKLAVALNNALRAGIPITHACFQNEPDGNQLNAVTGNWIAAYRELRELLDPRIKIIANEWRHPEKGIPEFDGLKTASQLHMLAAGALHIYDKAGNPALYDERWLKAGLPIWSCETGDGASPKTQARYVAGLLSGCAAEIAHIGHATAATKPDDLRQYLFDAAGKPLAWTPSCGLIARSVLPGTVMRGATSSDRPPGLGETQAERMLWWTAQRQPRQFVAGGRRADGRWVIASVSHAFGNDSPSQWAGGHYKAEKQQLTARVAELVGQNGTFLGQRCSIGGALGPVIKYPLVDGRLRWTLAPGETLVMVQAA